MPEQPENPDLHAGQGGEPAPGDIVGDSRRLRITSVSPNTGELGALAGEAWQDETGSLQGSGIAAAMLSEPVLSSFLRVGSIACDMSPLSMLHTMIAKSAFFYVEMVEG